MAREVNNKIGYSIPRTYKPFMYQLLGLVLVSDVLLVALLLMFVAIRNTLGLDSSLIWFSLLLSAAKTLIDLYGVYTLTERWLGVTYFVVNNRLYISSEVKSVDSEVIELKDMHKATAKVSFRGNKNLGYGDVEIKFAQRASSDSVILQGVIDPDTVVRRIASEMQSKK